MNGWDNTGSFAKIIQQREEEIKEFVTLISQDSSALNEIQSLGILNDLEKKLRISNYALCQKIIDRKIN